MVGQYDAGSGQGARQGIWALGLPLLFVLVFVFAFRYPAAMDIPNHIARAHVLNSCLGEETSPLCDNFTAEIRPISYFFSDYTLMLLVRLVPDAHAAGKVAIFVMLAANLIGWYLLFLRVNGRPNTAYIAGLFLLLNNFLYKGFYAYLLGNGALLLWLAYWWPRREHTDVVTSLRLSGGLFVLFLCHLAAFFSALFCLAAFAAWRLVSLPPHERGPVIRRYAGTWPLALSFLTLYGLQQLETGGAILRSVGAQGWTPHDGIGAWIILKFVRFSYVIVNHAKYADVAIFFSLLLLLLLRAGKEYLLGAARSFWFVAFCGLCAVYLVAPDISHGGGDVDLRFLLPAYYLLFLWLGAAAPSPAPAFTRAAVPVIVIAGFGMNLWFRAGMQRDLERLDTALQLVPARQSLVEINSRDRYPEGTASRVNPFSHFAANYLLREGSLVDGMLSCQMNPNIPYFCYRDTRRATTSFRNQFQGLPSLSAAELEVLRADYDYLLVVEPNQALVREHFPPARFRQLFHEGDVSLFKSLAP